MIFFNFSSFFPEFLIYGSFYEKANDCQLGSLLIKSWTDIKAQCMKDSEIKSKKSLLFHLEYFSEMSILLHMPVLQKIYNFVICDNIQLLTF